MYNANLVPVKRYRIRQDGLRGQAVSLPRIWTDGLGLKNGDALIFLQEPGSDDLIVRAERKPKGSK